MAPHRGWGANFHSCPPPWVPMPSLIYDVDVLKPPPPPQKNKKH